MTSNIAFIIVAYYPNKRTLQSLKNSLAGWSVVVVDNTKQNLGYGGGANVGIKKALKAEAQWVVVLNQDLRLTKRASAEFVRRLEKTKPGIAGPFAGGLDPRRWTTILPSKRVDYITGSCIAIHKDVLEKIGYFYEPYFLYYEEVDLCMRAKKAGFPLTHIPIEGVTHEESVSLGRGSLAHRYYLARNHLMFVERQAPGYIRCYEFLRMPKTIVEHIQKGQRGAMAGIRDYFFRSFGQYNRGQ